MPIAPKILEDALKLNPAAVRELLEGYFPTVHRMAFALCGDADAGMTVVERVFDRSLHAFGQWRDDAAADRWFYHFTVLESRRHQGDHSLEGDPLMGLEGATPAYGAFVRTLRGLPTQQREAMLLTYGERLNPRYLAVAMDCSGEAAENHLREATHQLVGMSGGDLESLLEMLSKAYRRLAPPAEKGRPMIERRVKRYLLPRRVRRVVIGLMLCAVAYAAWWWMMHR